MRRIRTAWRLIPWDGRLAAVRYLFGFYYLSDWEVDLLLRQEPYWNGE